MQQDFYKAKLIERGIEVLIPGDEDIEIINHTIFQELCLGIQSDASKMEFLRIVDSLAEQGAQGVILGCTEIGMLVKQEDTMIRLFDTTYIHANSAVSYAMNHQVG